MDSLIRLADAGSSLVSTRRSAVRGAVVGAILYGGFVIEGEIGVVLNGGFSFPRLLGGVAFGVVAGLLMGGAFAAILGRFRQRGFLAHQIAGVAAAAVLIAPPVIIGRSLFAPHAVVVGVASVLTFGICVGSAVWAYGRYHLRAA